MNTKVDPESIARDAEPVSHDVICTRRYENVTKGIIEDRKDLLGYLVEDILVWNEKFIVYSIRDGSDGCDRLRYHLSDDYEKASRLRANLAGVIGPIAYINDLASQYPRRRWLGMAKSQLYDKIRKRSLELGGQAIQLALEGSAASAADMLERFAAEIESRRDSRNRMRYVYASLVATIVMLASWFLMRPEMPAPDFLEPLKSAMAKITLDPAADPLLVIDVLAFGALGAFFAVSFDIRAIKVRYAISLWEMFYSGFSRVLIGVIAAAVVILLIRGDWVLGGLRPDIMPATYYLFGFLAGFSEMFIPNALKQLGSSTPVLTPKATPAQT